MDKHYKNADKPLTPPEDFPKIILADDAKHSELARNLMWEHSIPYGPKWDEWLHGEDGFPQYPELPSGPKATLWDGWMCAPELWPSIHTDKIHERMKALWKESFLSSRIGPDGYVETKQGVFYTHNAGWPFPLCSGGSGGCSWQFTFHNQAGEKNTPLGRMYRIKQLATDEGFSVTGFRNNGIDTEGWHLKVERPMATIETPDCAIKTDEAPFMQIRWFGENVPDNEPFLEWQREEDEDYSVERRMYFTPCPERKELVTEADLLDKAYTMLALYHHPQWNGTIKKIRIQFGNRSAEGTITLIGLFSHYDTRHNINNMQFIKGCSDYFNNTRDLDFLRRNIARMRQAMRGYMYDHHTATENVVKTTWVGHDGRPGIRYDEKGEKHIESGHGLHNNWMDLLPFGYYDCYATAYYYDALTRMEEIEQMLLDHPEWGIEEYADAFDPADLAQHRAKVKKRANELFFNEETGRFVAGVDIDGQAHDYGITLSNLEVLNAGLATDEHAKSVMDWISGRRIVEGDTSTGEDIYRYRFAPRITTRRNIEYYFWDWRTPEEIEFGNQIQDGGAALAFSYFDIMSRIHVYGGDDAYKRLTEMLDWYGEVCEEGGYHEYYKKRGMTLQGGGTGGGLGITKEFFESLLPVQSILYGFIGYQPKGERIKINPTIPSALDFIKITNIAWCNVEMDIEVSRVERKIKVTCRGDLNRPFIVKTDCSDYQIEIIR